MEKTYNFQEIELKITERWEKAHAFCAGAGANPEAEPFTIVLPPPNVTGSLHMGHALNSTLQDILIRFERMRGKNVLWQPGLDHAGIATQMIVERQLLKKGIQRQNLTREEFINYVWLWKKESGGQIFDQLKKIGASCDWGRERFTMDEGFSQVVVEVFVTLYKQGLIYRDKRLVNWDPALLTAISDLEVESREMQGTLWFFRYPIEGACFDPNDEQSFLSVATTRPETIFGDTAVAVHPEDVRYKKLIGSYLILPLIGRRIPVVGDYSVNPEKGTGAVKVTPAHDFNDLEIAKRACLPHINVFTPNACMALVDNDDFWFGMQKTDESVDFVQKFHGLDRFEARKKILSCMKDKGFFVKDEPHQHVVPHGDRSGVPIEPMLTNQWYVNTHELAQPALAAVKNGDIHFIPDHWKKTYFDWMDNIQPWCISRQLWWGHQIPAWYGPDGHVFVELTQKEALDSAIQHYLSQEGHWKDWIEERLKNSSAEGILHQDTDVLDTWFSSALWPFVTLGWPNHPSEFLMRYPSNVLITGFDIIFFWVARMIMAGLHFTGEKPFHTVYVHALVRDAHGAKMSKSKGNVIDPLDLIKEYGADSLRFMLASLSVPGSDIRLDTSRVEACRNFATKLWNASRFTLMNGAVYDEGFSLNTVSFGINRWILTELSYATRDITEALCSFRFHDASSVLFRFVRNLFCDWYLELLKPVFMNAEECSYKAECQKCVGFVLGTLLKALHPFMPFITEELWVHFDKKNTNLICHSSWPHLEFEDIEATAEINWLIKLISEVRSVRSEMRVPAAAVVSMYGDELCPRVKKILDGHALVLKKLARVENLTCEEAIPSGNLQIIVEDTTFFLCVGDSIDLSLEIERLSKELEKIKIKTDALAQKLSNHNFLSKASQDVVEGEQEKMSELLELSSTIKKALLRIRP